MAASVYYNPPSTNLKEYNGNSSHVMEASPRDVALETTPSYVHPTPAQYKYSDLFQESQAAALLIILIGGLASNGLVFLLFYRKPTLRTFSNRFVLNLSAAHIMQCVIIIPYVFVSTIVQNWVFGEIWCQVTGAAVITLNIASVFSLVLIAVDRNCAVNSPLHYSITITKRSTGGLITGTWVMSILASLPPLFGISRIEYRPEWSSCMVSWFRKHPFSIAYASFLATAAFLVPFLKMCWIYCSMFRAARMNCARARQHSLTSSMNDVQVTAPTTPKTSSSTSSVQIHKKKIFLRRSSSSSNSSVFGEEWKAVKTCLLAMLSFTLCWLPFFAIFATEPLLEDVNWIPEYVPPLVTLFSLSACVINPYLYVFRNKNTRKHVKRLFKYMVGMRDNSFIRYDNHRHRNLRYVSSSVVISNGKEIQSTISDMPTLYQDTDGRWQMVVPENPSREDVVETMSSLSDDCLDYGMSSSSMKHSRLFCDETPVRPTYYRRMSLDNNVLSGGSRDSEYDVMSFQSNDPLLIFKFRAQRGSSESDSTDNGRSSFDSANDDAISWYSLLSHRKDSKGSISTLQPSEGAAAAGPWHQPQPQPLGVPVRPVLRRTASVVMEEQELAILPRNMSRSGRFRRSFFIASRSCRRNSSDTTGTPSTSTESQDCPTPPCLPTSVRARPKLVRQHSAVVFNYHPTPHPEQQQIRRGSIAEGVLLDAESRHKPCYFITDEGSSNRTVRFVEER